MNDLTANLFIDRTTSNNIIWATDDYIEYGERYTPFSQITPELVTVNGVGLIRSKVHKPAHIKNKRVKTRAEVFTPTWIIKRQNDTIDEEYKADDLETYIKRVWLEMACGEAPYMTSCYDMLTGEPIPLSEKVGFIDRKFSRLNREVDDYAEWRRLAILAFSSSYGFEWSGDSLLIARKNLLQCFYTYYFDKWDKAPSVDFLTQISEIISYNVFQMDGLNYTIPFSDREDNPTPGEYIRLREKSKNKLYGLRVKIRDWENNKIIYFDEFVDGKEYLF